MAAFHAFFSRHPDRHVRYVYQRLAPTFHRHLRGHERDMFTREDFGDKLVQQLYRHLLSARILILSAPPDFYSLSPEDLIAAALLATTGADVRSAAASLIEENPTSATHRLHLRRLFGLPASQIDPSAPPAGDRRVPGARSVYFVPRSCLDDDEPDVIVATPSAEVLAEGETEADYLTSDLEVPPPTAPVDSREVARQRRRWAADAITRARLGHPYEEGTIQPIQFMDLYDAFLCKEPRRMAMIDAARGLWLVLTNYYCLPPSVLEALPLTTGTPEGTDGPALDPDTWTLWLPLPRIGYRFRRREWDAVCRAGSEWIQLPLFRWARQLAEAYRDWFAPGYWPPDRLFDAAALGLRASSMVTAVDDALRVTVRSASSARLARSSRRWLVHHGLPRVIAAMVSTRYDFATLATSAYINLAVEEFTAIHRAACAAFHQRVLGEHAYRAAGGPLGHLGDSALFDVEVPPGLRFGSYVLVKAEAVRESLDALRERIRPLNVKAPVGSLIRHLNLRVLYEYLRLSWGTALRPYRDPAAMLVAGIDDWIVVEDKDSPTSAERRPVPLPLGVAHPLHRFRETERGLRQRLRHAGIEFGEVPEGAALYIVDPDTRRALPPTAERVRALLNAEGLDVYFPWPLNAPRHYWVSRAIRLLKHIEPFLGHVSDRPPWGPYALVSLTTAAQVFRAFGDAVLKEVGFVDLP